jgi:hypothetical protein
MRQGSPRLAPWVEGKNDQGPELSVFINEWAQGNGLRQPYRVIRSLGHQSGGWNIPEQVQDVTRYALPPYGIA